MHVIRVKKEIGMNGKKVWMFLVQMDPFGQPILMPYINEAKQFKTRGEAVKIVEKLPHNFEVVEYYNTLIKHVYTDIIEEWCMDRSHVKENLFIKKLKNLKFDNQQIVNILGVIETTCHECFNSDKSCQCWNDE